MSRTTRRGLLGGAAVLAVATPVIAADHPDASLLADCQAFDVLERAYHQTCKGEDDPAKEAEGDRLVELQRPILDRICGSPARTLEGLQAKARSLVLWDEFAIDDDAACTHDRIRSSLLRNLLAAGGA